MSDDHTWAKEKVKDLVFGCVLNFKLKLAGICPKFICEMNDQDYLVYQGIVSSLAADDSKDDAKP